MRERFERAVAVRVVRPYVVEVSFDDGHRRLVDVEPFLGGPVFAPLRDPELFAQAAVEPIGGAIYWPTGADLAPEFLYYGYETPYGRVAVDLPETVGRGDAA